jgi:hypothetical protein
MHIEPCPAPVTQVSCVHVAAGTCLRLIPKLLCAAPAGSCRIEIDTDYPGNDIDFKCVNFNAPKECCDACKANPQCK